MSFQDKVVLVTGGASGIGAAATRAFAREGARVAFTYATSRNEAAALAAELGALALPADLTRPEVVAEIFARTERELGPLDVLFANAGGLLQRSRCVDTSLDLWNQAIAVNLTSTFLCCQAALRSMEPRRGGAIVTMSSLAAFDGGGFGAAHYAATKGAVATFTRSLAKEVGPLGIRVKVATAPLVAA